LMGKDPNSRSQYSGERWYDMACVFTDGWDQTSFDPEYDTLPLSHFEPMIDRVFASPQRELMQTA
jgi:hypothetical protein